MKQSSKRRIFIKSENNFYQLFSFDQHNDGSIYCNMPEFPEIQWMSIIQHEGTTKLAIVNPLKIDGKLSIHGSGMTTYRPHSDNKGHKLIVKGNHLVKFEEEKIGLRHLFTTFLQEPKFLPTSPAFKRATDY